MKSKITLHPADAEILRKNKIKILEVRDDSVVVRLAGENPITITNEDILLAANQAYKELSALYTALARAAGIIAYPLVK